MKVFIKPLKKDHIDQIMDIEAKCYGEHHWGRSSFEGELKNDISYYFVMENDENKVLGYLGTWQIFEEAHITTLAIDPVFRRKKLAQALLIAAFKDCYEKKIKYITLEVRDSNQKAINLYEKFNMKSLGKRKGYYQDNNEDALIMWSENIWHQSFLKLYNKNKQEMGDLEIIYE